MSYGATFKRAQLQGFDSVTDSELVAAESGRSVKVPYLFCMSKHAGTVLLESGNSTRVWELYPAANGGAEIRAPEGQFLFETTAGEALTVTTRVGGQYLDLPGVNGSADSDYTTAITAEITLSARIRPDDFTPAADQAIGGQYGAATDRNHYFALDTTGILLFVYSIDGTAIVEIVSTVTLGSVGAVDGEPIWVRVHHDNDDGANAVTKFYYSLDETNIEADVSWTQLGDTVSGAQLAARSSSTFAHKVGILNTADSDFVGDIYSYSARAGAPTTALVYNPLFFDTSQGWVVGDDASDTGVDVQRNTWTLSNDARITTSIGDGSGDFYLSVLYLIE